MRPRTKNEKILLALLVGIVFAGGNYFGYEWVSQKQSALQLTRAELRADQAAAEVDLQKADLWAQRGAWIRAHEPPLGEEDDAKAQLAQVVQKGARDHQLEILEQNLGNDEQHGAAGTQLNMTIKVKGPMEGLCEWLADLQKPEHFYAIALFSLKADQDQKSMVCTLQVARYFKKGA